MRNVIVCVGGGIAAYKSAILVSRLTQAGFSVRVAMTASAQQFIGPVTLAALSGHPVATQSFDSQQFPLGPHIEWSQGADLMVVAPATADLIAKFASGIADDFVTTLYLQVECPVLIAPAMSNAMWAKPAVQRNVHRLRDDGIHQVGPDSGWLSCRQQGEGRMAEPEAILQSIQSLLSS
jgi:phosphopantothenoylcysteine decarboxylase